MNAPKTITMTVDETTDKKRLDQALAHCVNEFSRSQHQQWIKEGQVMVNNHLITSCRHILNINDIIVLNVILVDKYSWLPIELPLDIIHEDESIIIINKPPGLVMHPGAGEPVGTLANALLHHFPESRKIPRAGIVHRLDKDTSGLCVVARTNDAYHFLTNQMKNRKITRQYLTMVHGQVFCSGTIETFIDRHPTKRTVMAVTPKGKPAITHYKIIKKYQNNTLLKVQLETGRTHQIRVHMAHMNHPVCADPTYNKPINHYTQLPTPVIKSLKDLNRQALHACHLSLQHPSSKHEMTWESSFPEDISLLQKQLDEHQEINTYD